MRSYMKGGVRIWLGGRFGVRLYRERRLYAVRLVVVDL